MVGKALGKYVAAGSTDGSLFIWDNIGTRKPRKLKCAEHRQVPILSCTIFAL